MKLYVTDIEGRKHYLKTIAKSRGELYRQLGGSNFQVGGVIYNINQVKAEKDTDQTSLGAVIGGAVGAFAGIPGFLAGAAIGGALGYQDDKKEIEQVNLFNTEIL
ncbi:hypothetical protein ACFOEK_12265 [Litoribrevibacter euphylliae]|uniref:Glycine zipper domain-containing protein n=1 Tax=Litoribrevibacter euphylliae TaxID=1834034 RepID=A0ABV7HI42_9GAMM